MKKKHWQVSVFDKTSEIIKDDTIYTTDTEVYLVFELIDKNFRPDSATVTIYNIYGTATINESVDIVNGIVNYEMPEDAIGHAGGWRTQVVFTKDNEDYTTTVIEFDVDGHLLDNNKPTIVYIENWNSFIKHGEGLVDDWEQLEKIRQANERKRESAETVRKNIFETNETGRQTNELVRKENEQARESAESVRVANEEERELNEAGRISKDSERDSKIEAIEEDVEVAVTNLFPYNEVLAKGYSSATFVNLTLINNHKYYTRRVYTLLKGDNNAVSGSVGLVNPSVHLIGGIESYPNQVGVVMDYSGETRTNGIYLYGSNTPDSEGNREARFSDLIIIDLTETFGVGNEPTAEQMDRLLEQFPSGWFDGTVNAYNSKLMMAMFFNELAKLNNAITTLGGNV